MSVQGSHSPSILLMYDNFNTNLVSVQVMQDARYKYFCTFQYKSCVGSRMSTLLCLHLSFIFQYKSCVGSSLGAFAPLLSLLIFQYKSCVGSRQVLYRLAL